MAGKKIECKPIIESEKAKVVFLEQNPSGRVTFNYGVKNCVNYIASGDTAGGYCVVAETRCRLAKNLSTIRG